ncbi:hypothetical protein [Bacteroides ihuae]|uniref:hypothetical protein n=1 Tax=Bacteroides ihuae TaxID=1852362 RepID=UPI0008D9FC5E|nr:hypothetical protein [Bacteroides ihuae]
METATKNSSLMRDDTKGYDGQIEAIMDYIISWTLRRSQQEFSKKAPLLYEYSRNILGKLLGITMDDSVSISNVNVKKQHLRIDLWVNVTLSVKGIDERHAILIENKAYSYPHLSRDEDGEYRSQLEVYKKKFDTECEEVKISKRHYILITCHEDEKHLTLLKNECENYNFEVLSLTDIQSNGVNDTESDLFNEFWLRYW